MHILSCLGSGTKYSPYKGQPSSLQLLRARQGFKEKARAVRSSWVRGIINDQSVAMICSAALLEDLTAGWDAVVEVLDQALAMVLPGHDPSKLGVDLDIRKCMACQNSVTLHW